MNNEEALNKIEKLNNLNLDRKKIPVIFSGDIQSSYNLYEKKQVEKIVNENSK